MLPVNYDGTQDEEYEIARLICQSCEDNLAKFTLYKSKYDLPFLAGIRNQIKAAELLPDDTQRKELHETLRIALTHKLSDCSDMLQGLKGYISEAFGKELESTMFSAAGFDDYAAAMNENWDMVKKIMGKANTFIGSHSADLLGAGFMPAGFPAAFTLLADSMEPDITAFLNARENTTKGADAKVQATNDVHTALMSICSDGFYIFRNEKATQDQFVYNQVMAIVSQPGAAGVNADAKDAVTNELLTGVSYRLQKDGEPSVVKVSGENAKAIFSGLSAGHYTMVVTLDGKKPINDAFDLIVGVTSFKHYVMESL